MEDTNGEPGRVQDPRRLTSLPGEAISRILIHIDHSDIPAVMLTCKTLCSAIMTRQFWYHRIHRLCREHLVSPPEEELEEYTVAELEKWTLRRIWARCNLPTKLHLRSRNVDMSLETSSLLLLIPGGRWLLMFRFDGFVYSFDLDSNYSNRYTLFDPSQVGPRTRNSGITYPGECVWIDHKAPRLTFRWVIAFLDSGDDRLLFSRVQIYQVNLIGHGSHARLVAHIIATFRTPRKRAILSCTFNDRYLVQDREGSHVAEMEIYDYRQALGRLDYPPIKSHAFPLGGNSKSIEFINEDVLVVHYREPYLRIFNIESPTSIIQLHTSNSCPGWLNSSRTCWTPEASLVTRIQESTRGWGGHIITIYGIVIPHNKQLSPWTVELGKFVQRENAHWNPGIFISMSSNEINNISYIGHEWDFTSQNSTLTHFSILKHDMDRPQKFVTFDEDIGRSVHFGPGKMNVVDIVMTG